MYTNVSNIVDTVILVINTQRESIDKLLHTYVEDSCLNIIKGNRKVIPDSAMPSLEIEPVSATTEWATLRAQRPRYELSLKLSVRNSNEDYGVEYITSIANFISQILTNPLNLQLKIVNEVKWDLNEGLVETYILDSFSDNVSYSASKDGSIRTAEFNWWCVVHETYPDWWHSKYNTGETRFPTIIQPTPRNI